MYLVNMPHQAKEEGLVYDHFSCQNLPILVETGAAILLPWYLSMSTHTMDKYSKTF